MITLEQVKEVAASLDKNQVNPGTRGNCFYVNSDGTPACIAAQIFTKLHGNDWCEVILGLEDSRNSSVNASEVPSIFGWEYESDAKEWLDWVQLEADHYNPWGEAIEKGNALYNNEKVGN